MILIVLGTRPQHAQPRHDAYIEVDPELSQARLLVAQNGAYTDVLRNVYSRGVDDYESRACCWFVHLAQFSSKRHLYNIPR